MVAGNWKMHGSRASISNLLDGIVSGMDQIQDVDTVVCPPFVYLP